MGFRGFVTVCTAMTITIVCPVHGETIQRHDYGAAPLVALDGTVMPDSIWNTSAVVLDTHLVVPTAQYYYPKGLDLGQHFKGAADDTIRIAAVYARSTSGDTLKLIMLTDTTTSAFGQAYFRSEVIYTYPGYSPCPVVLGNVDGDDCTDIVFRRPSDFWNNKVIMWIEWDEALSTWAARDSITFVGKDIADIVIGDADNDGNANEIICATCRWDIIRMVWTEAGWDTTIIPLYDARSYGVAIGDARPDLPGNEIYVAGHDYPESRLWMVRWTGSNWYHEVMCDFLWPGSNMIEEAADVDVGDVDPLLPGNEVAVTHTHGGGGLPYTMHYQLSLFNWNSDSWAYRTWHWPDYYGMGGDRIAIGDVIPENPGQELIVTQDYVNNDSKVFWLAPNGGAFMKDFYFYDYSCLLAIGDVNKFRDIGEEYLIASIDGILAVQAHDFVNDVGTYYFRMNQPTSTQNTQDTIQAVIFNAGSQPQAGFTVGYCLKNSTLKGTVTYTNTILPSDTGYVALPITFDFLGMDTLYVYTDLAGDAYSGNDTVPLHIEVYDDSTEAASGFNHRIFPPVNGTSEPYDWQAIILSEGKNMNWYRYPQPQYPPGPPLEGYAGARFVCYGMPAFRVARLRTHKFTTGDTPRRVFTTFYIYNASWQMSFYGCSLYVAYSHDDITYNHVWGIELPMFGWHKYEVELGDFPAHTNLYVGITASSGGGGPDWFIDSVRVWTAFPARKDAAMIDAYVLPRPVIVHDTFNVFATIKNFGSDRLTSTPVFYTFGDADTVWETWNGVLEHYETDVYSFVTPYACSEARWETLFVGTRMYSDERPGNDAWHRPLEICDSVLLPPYTKDFNEEWENSIEPPYDGWKIIDGGTQSPPYVDMNDWHRNADSTYTPPRTIACINYFPYETHDDWLISPRFDCTREGTYLLSYWHYYRDYYPSQPDSGRVLVSTDDGATWTTVASYSNYCYPGFDESHNITEIVKDHTHVKIAFNYVATQEDYWHIDDFLLDYQVDTIPPAAPHLIHVQKSGTNVVVRWNKVTTDAQGSDETVTHYTVYRSTAPDYMPDVLDSIGVVGHPGTTFTDVGALTSVDDYYYLIKAVDDCDNRSAKSNMGYKFSRPFRENVSTKNKN